MQPQQPYAPSPAPSQYEFITNPQKPGRSLDAGSKKQRLLVVGLSLVGLMIVAVVLINLLSSGDESKPALTKVLQEQQSIIHITTAAATQPGVTSDLAASVVTINISLTSEKSELVTYFKKNSFKLDLVQLNANVSPTLDAQLKAAAESGTYNSFLRSTLKTQLQTYQLYLKQAYTKVKGPVGKQLVKQDFDGAKLLEQKLDSSSN